MLLCLGVSVWYFRFKADINLPNLDKINTILTDGNKAVSEGDSDNWVTFTKDANELGQGKLSIDKIPTFSVGLDKNFDYKKFDNINLMNESENITKKLQEAKIDTVKLPIELNNFYNNSKNIPSRVEEEVEKFYSEGFNVVGRLDLTSRQGINSEHFITAGVDLKEIAHVKPFPIDLINRENDQFGESVEVQNDTAKLKLIDSDHPLISKNISDEDYLYFFDANTPLENTEEIIPLGYHCDKMFNLKNVADPKTLKLWVSTTGKDEDYVEQNEGSEGYIFYGPKELQVKKYCHGKIKIQYSGADPQRSYLNKIDYDINPITGDIQTKNNNINSGYVEKEDFNSGQMSGNLHWLNEGEHQIVDGKLNIKSSNANGLGAMLYQEISGTGNFKVAFKIDPVEARGIKSAKLKFVSAASFYRLGSVIKSHELIDLKCNQDGLCSAVINSKNTGVELARRRTFSYTFIFSDQIGNKFTKTYRGTFRLP